LTTVIEEANNPARQSIIGQFLANDVTQTLPLPPCRYINIDAGYLVRERDASGNLQVDAIKFPGGMKPVADKIHALGLKLGVYTDITNRSCGLGPGSEGHYEQDARQFASWGVDYLKVDYCGAMHMGPNDYTQWAALRDALYATGRPIYYSICPKTNAPGNGTATPYAHRRVYSPPQNWTASERHALSNSQLVEYTNNGDTWWSTDPVRQSEGRV
jgi:alpha-galactosidase